MYETSATGLIQINVSQQIGLSTKLAIASGAVYGLGGHVGEFCVCWKRLG